jgi:hypothetical protein
MVCPRCAGYFEQKLICPNCKVRLVFRSTRRDAGLSAGQASEPWQQTPWSRLFIGLLLAQGIYFGLKYLCMAGLLLNAEEPNTEVWTDHAGPFVLLTLQCVGLFLGGSLAGAGQRRGAAYGFVIGTVDGLIFAVLFRANVPDFGPISVIGVPVFLGIFGLVSGWIGSTIWKPPEPFAGPNAQQIDISGFITTRQPLGLFSGPISWLRVSAGLAITVAGSLAARKSLGWLMDASPGIAIFDDLHQLRLLVWGIMAVFLLVGSMIAGSAVKNSLKQGLIVGIATTLCVIGHRLIFKGVPNLEWLLLAAGLTVSTCLLGSWFGGQLMPPVFRFKRRSRFGPLG